MHSLLRFKTQVLSRSKQYENALREDMNVVMNGLSGLERVFTEEFPKAKIQRYQIHVLRNVLGKVPRKLKKTVADEIRSIFYASSRKYDLSSRAIYR